MNRDSLIQIYGERLADNGPIYHETNLSNFLVEPWNAFSSLTFLIPAIYFLYTLKGNYKTYSFLVYVCSPLLILGGLGSTFYHAFRASTFFLILDVAPIIVLTLSVSIYFLIKILPHWWYAVAITVIVTASRFLMFGIESLPEQTKINISYFITGLFIFVPALFYMIQTKYHKVKHLLFAILFFCLALFFRFADDWAEPIFTRGTHWLWHICTTVGAYFLGNYIMKLKMREFELLKVHVAKNI
jgi:hypothetical protein